MDSFQIWLVSVLASAETVAGFMRTKWAWPVSESLHFTGLGLLFGTIGIFDLRLLGVAKGIPIAALHKLVPWGVGGFFLTVATGMLFLLTEPDQYIFNSAFHLKVLFMFLAGLNMSLFYLVAFPRVKSVAEGEDVPFMAKCIGGASLCLWLGVIIFGRLLTFYRPFPCGPEGPGFVSACLSWVSY